MDWHRNERMRSNFQKINKMKEKIRRRERMRRGRGGGGGRRRQYSSLLLRQHSLGGGRFLTKKEKVHTHGEEEKAALSKGWNATLEFT
jgi:hypothetical protein